MIYRCVAGLLLSACLLSTATSAQQPRASRPATPAAGDPSAELSRGWAALAKGQAVEAGKIAGRLLDANPRSGAVLALALEASIAGGGASAGLEQYERWLGKRPLEEPAALRRVARAALKEAAAEGSQQAVRTAALAALVQEGDSAAARELESLRGADRGVTTRILAATGDEAAVRTLSESIGPGSAESVLAIEALGTSGRAAAVEPLVVRLDDERSEVRAAAAEGLGRLGATDQAGRLRELLSDRNTLVRLKAAGSLLRLGDDSGVPVLREFMGHSLPSVRLAAAEAMSARPDAEWKALVAELAAAPHPEVQIGAARLLAAHDPERAFTILEGFATHDNPAIRALAARASGEIDTRDLTVLRRQMRHASPLGRVRAAARVLVITR